MVFSFAPFTRVSFLLITPICYNALHITRGAKAMGLFDKIKKMVSDDASDTSGINILTPLSGEIVALESVPDVVFSEKIVGDGVAIKPTGDKIVAPFNGTISKIFETNHAF